MSAPEPQLDSILLEPKRLQICGALAGVMQVEFAVVRDVLDVADSVLSKHLKTLEGAGYVTTSKQRATSGRPRTWAQLTPAGRAALQGHVAALQRLAGVAAGGAAAPSPAAGRGR